MPICPVNGLKIYYEVSGEGFPLVLIHANPFDRRLWIYQVAHFSAFFKVINVDLRGYGYSDKPASPTSIVEMGEDVVGVCRQDGALPAHPLYRLGQKAQRGVDHRDLQGTPG